MRRVVFPTVAVLTLILSACAPLVPNSSNDAQLKQGDGKLLADELLIIDTHIDVPYRLKKKPANVAERTESGQFDYPRAKQGGLNVPFMSIYIPAKVEEEGNAKIMADELIDLVENIVSANPEKFALAASTQDIGENFAAGKISMAMGMENGGPIESRFENLKHFHDRGIRYITLTHSKSNHISDSSYDENKRWGGLSPFGKNLIPEMNNIGMMVDISHVSDDAFYDVMRLSRTPVIASHSSARFFVKDFERNMSDEMLLALKKNGGVMQLNIGSTFISQASRDSRAEQVKVGKAYFKEHKIDEKSEAAKPIIARIQIEHPFQYATMSDVLDHVDHVVKLIGINYIGIGSDFDGVGDSLPIGFKDVSDYPAFIDGLISRGYSKQDIEKILGGNLMRVWREVEAYAASH